MIRKISLVFVSVVFSLVKCEPPSPQYGAPISSYGTPNYNTHNNNYDDHSEPKSYEFGYQVKDDYSGNNYKRQEASDGNQVQGEYRVQLPDGRTQIVTYYADWQTGFHADVRYEGQASYPETYGTGNYHHGGPGSFGGAPSNQYGVPGFGNSGQQHHGSSHSSHSGGYAGNFGFNSAPATSSVSIKDYSGPGTPYNTGGGSGSGSYSGAGVGGGYNFGNSFQQQHHGGGFDSYSNAAGFGGKFRPSSTYGAP